MLEKTLESPLDCKEIQPVHPKGDQSWVFIGKTDDEAETSILWPPDAIIHWFLFILVIPPFGDTKTPDIILYGVSLVVQMIKNLPAMHETCVHFLGWEDPLEKGMATHSSILAWRIPQIEKHPWWTTSP